MRLDKAWRAQVLDTLLATTSYNMQREFKEPLFTDRKIQGEPGLGYGVFATKKIAEGILTLAATPEFYTEYFPYTGIRSILIYQYYLELTRTADSIQTAQHSTNR